MSVKATAVGRIRISIGAILDKGGETVAGSFVMAPGVTSECSEGGLMESSVLYPLLSKYRMENGH